MKYSLSLLTTFLLYWSIIPSTPVWALTLQINSNGNISIVAPTSLRTSSKSSSSKASSAKVKSTAKPSSSRPGSTSSPRNRLTSNLQRIKDAESSPVSRNPNLMPVGFYTFEAGNGQWLISRPLPNSPAEMAGLREGDEIISIEGKEVRHITRAEENDVLDHLEFPKKGSTLHLRIARVNFGEKDITIVVNPPLSSSPIVTSEMQNGVGIIRVHSWNTRSTTASFYKELTELLSKKPNALVLDLRRPVDVAITTDQILHQDGEILAAFVAKGTFYGTQTQSKGKMKTSMNLQTERDPLMTPGSIPIVVLTHTGDLYPTKTIAGLIFHYAGGKTLLETDPNTYGSTGLDTYNHYNDPPGVTDPALEEAIHRTK